jgi:hypothetical protein
VPSLVVFIIKLYLLALEVVLKNFSLHFSANGKYLPEFIEASVIPSSLPIGSND